MNTVKPVLNGLSQNDQKLFFKTDYRLMQVKSISAIFSAFIKLPFVIKIFVLSTFEWPLKTGFTVFSYHSCLSAEVVRMPKNWINRCLYEFLINK